MFDTIRRIKWKNITGLVLLILIIFAVIAIAAFLSTVFYGDCVEKSGVKVCFSMDKSAVKQNSGATITTDITNMGETLRGVLVTMRMSPNLVNTSATWQEVGSMAPGDTVKRKFHVSSKDELGRFTLEFDINNDGKTDKELYLSVE